MTKKNNILTLTALFTAICIFLGAVFAMGVRADDEEYYYPSIYCNDSVWYMEDIFPLDRYYQTYYVPASLFASFDSVTVVPNERFETLLISYNKGTTKYISFNINTDLALTDSSEEIYAMTYTKDGERYVPAELVCRALGFSFEYRQSNRYSITAMRICDGNQKKDFSELVSLFSRGDNSDSTDEVGVDTTTPPIVDFPITPDSKTIYLTFDKFDSNTIDDIISVLDKYSVKATFFICNDELRKYDASVIKLVAAGHSLGLAFDAMGFEVDCVDAFERQNSSLMRLIKHESRFVRIYGADNLEKENERAKNAEYTIWGWDLELFANDVQGSLQELESAATQNDTLTLRFCADANICPVLDAALEKLTNMDFVIKTINDATGADKTN